jgi:hypothetical protein
VIGSASILAAGERLELTVGEAADITPARPPERIPAPSASAPPEPPPSASPAESAEPDAGSVDNAPPAGAAVGSREPGPEVVDFVLGAGDSVVVHDPRPPTSVGFTSKCATGSILSMGGRARETVGGARVSGEFPSGRHRYVVSCLRANGEKGERAGAGTLTVLADSGLRRIARTAPTTHVDTDGRRYTVLYQTLLPKLVVRWPSAPTAASFTLSVRSSSGSRTLTSKTPTQSFAAGTFAEGDHTLIFEGGGQRSRPTSVAVRFDNAAPTASISSPADGSFGPGAGVIASGSALPGWTVSAAGRELAQDAQSRFSGEVAAPSAERALVIRFFHPSRGMHYYLRRSGR